MIPGRRYISYPDQESSSSDNDYHDIPLPCQDNKFRHRPEFCSRDFSASISHQLITDPSPTSQEKENIWPKDHLMSYFTLVVFMCIGSTKCLEFLNFFLLKFENHGISNLNDSGLA